MNSATPAELFEVQDRDARELRNLLGQFATGVTVITTRTADGRNVGMTANSFSSVSLDPPLVLWSLARSAMSLNDFLGASHFAINILGAHQHEISGQFARPAPDKFAGVPYALGKADMPVLDDVVAALVCRNVTQYEGGDHLIFIGEIEQYRYSGAEPLVFHAGRYRIAAQHPALAQ
ncbi:flavin reductase family protein [Pseudomonas sp. DTU_2021_1001937_2_SI_NGA_ILE_001]|uniref:flavin reductase family protein n=1 Tax=Pseudomonas sp. DTU_2021_1001937_2_SI_NGA_ILE_001 TaxID=3077589 RepID=UPI0025ED3103|nr:flavin reductase family protein [Pseudomonas sp. DTU_2021_1001937_2_SI_NGA_ILE_001]WNW10436.1 flavin reductase family protein [Pseudomonas sp. DTU_2021_1001937_2_SI_NGA_ILE_001]